MNRSAKGCYYRSCDDTCYDHYLGGGIGGDGVRAQYSISLATGFQSTL